MVVPELGAVLLVTMSLNLWSLVLNSRCLVSELNYSIPVGVRIFLAGRIILMYTDVIYKKTMKQSSVKKTYLVISTFNLKL